VQICRANCSLVPGVLCYDVEIKRGIIPKTLKICAWSEKRDHKTVNISLAVSFWLLKNYKLKSWEHCHCFRHNKQDKEAVKQQDKANDVARGS